MPISVEETGNNQLNPGQERMWDVPGMSHSSLLRNRWSKPTGMLEHGREGETNYFENNYSFGTILDTVPAKQVPMTT